MFCTCSIVFVFVRVFIKFDEELNLFLCSLFVQLATGRGRARFRMPVVETPPHLRIRASESGSSAATDTNTPSSASSNLDFANTIMEQTHMERKRNEEEMRRQREEIKDLKRKLQTAQQLDSSQPSTSTDTRAFASATRRPHEEDSDDSIPPLYGESMHQIKKRRRKAANLEAKYMRLTGRPVHTYVPIKVEPNELTQAQDEQADTEKRGPLPVIDLTVDSDEERSVKVEQPEEVELQAADPTEEADPLPKPAEILWERPKDRIKQMMSARSAANKIYQDEYMDLPPDFDSTPTKAPKANTSKRKPGKRAPRPAWIYIPRRWALCNFDKYLIGDSNIRYRNQTFASICHHLTSDWDTHALCPQCYIDLGIPLCRFAGNLSCDFCDAMGAAAHAAREKLIKSGEKTSRTVHVPSNVYTQNDADEWMKATSIWQTPNPDWLLKGEPVGTCFPADLVQPGTNVADAVRQHPEWKTKTWNAVVIAHNTAKDRPQTKGVITTSDRKKVKVPHGLCWTKTPDPTPAATPRRARSKDSSQPQAQQQELQAIPEEVVEASQLAIEPSADVGGDSIKKSVNACEQLAKAVAVLVEQRRLVDMPNTLNHDLALLQADVQTREVVQTPTSVAATASHLQLQVRAGASASDGAQNPFDKAKLTPPPTKDIFKEANLQLDDWKETSTTEEIHGEPKNETLCNVYQQKLAAFARLDMRETWWYRYSAQWEDQLRPESFIDLMAEPDVTLRYWDLMEEMAKQNPYDLRIETSPHLSKWEGLRPHFLLHGIDTAPDFDNKFPRTDDTLPITQGEIECMRIMSNITVKLNNCMLVCSRLMQRMLRKGLSNIPEGRQGVTVVSDLMATAADLQKDACLKMSVLSTLIQRRDAMLRNNLEPTICINQFTSPYPTKKPFPTVNGKII